MSDLETAMRRAAPSLLALSCVGFIASAAPAAAQSTVANEERAPVLGGMTVTGSAIIDEFKVEVESPKATRALIDTPQTITVIGDQVIRKQNLLTLRDVLATVPGITFGAGEGGGGYGDSIILRGYSANNDITQDGVRDSAQYSRTETFNLQQIEVYNGANSVFNGSGSVGGTINLVSKLPQAEDLTIASAGIGTDDYYRATVDTNLRLTDTIAVRLNAVGHRNDIPGRDVESNKRWGFAPSVTLGIDRPTSLTLSYIHQRDHNIPVYGVPYFRNGVNDGPLPGVRDSTYFGIENLDEQDIFFDQLTTRFSHEFSDTVSIRNLTRWQRVEQNSDTSAPQGVFCLASGFQPLGTASAPTVAIACPAATSTTAAQNVPGTYYPSGPRGNVRDQENQLLYNQTDLRAVATTGALEHTFVIGASFTQEDYTLLAGSLLPRLGSGTVAPLPRLGLPAPDTDFTGPVNFSRAGYSQGDTRNAAVYFFDTTKIGERFEVNGAVRYEHNRAVFRADTYSIVAGPTFGAYTRGRAQVNTDDLLSYRLGLNYKPAQSVSIYAAYGNSRVPTSATVRLGCGVLLAPAGAPAGTTVDACDVAAEKAVNHEIGIKADLFERRLQLTAAAFRNDRTNYRVATNDPIIPTLPVADGHSRVDGIALGASGNITEAWAIFANYTYLDSEVKQSVSDFCKANPGRLVTSTATPPVTTNACGNSSAVLDPQRGDQLINTPRHSGSLFTTYTLPFGLQLGYGFTYQGSFALNNSALVTPLVADSTALTPIYRSKAFLTHRAFLSYAVMEGLTAQLNVQNFTDKRHFTAIRNNGWATPGEDRAARFSLFYSF